MAAPGDDDRGSHMLKGVPEPWQVFAARC